MRTVIAFDIASDRKRYRVTQVLLGQGVRVQKSVFEMDDLQRGPYLRLRSRLEGIIDADTDSLRYYPLCAACVQRIEHFGRGPGRLSEPPDVEFI